MYDALIVGAGLFGATFARKAAESGSRVLVIDRRNHAGGNIYDEEVHGVTVHKYGPHIFHTDDEEVYDFLKQFTDFHPYRHRVLANSREKTYPIPINLETLKRLFGIATPEDAKIYYDENCCKYDEPENFEEVLLNRVGPELYHLFFEEYTQKQWGRSARYLPPEMGSRVPVRYDDNDEYFTNRHQGVSFSYAKMIARMLEGIDVRLDTDFFGIENWRNFAKCLVFTGEIDRLFGYQFGKLEYVRLRFEEKYLPATDCFQETAVVNYPEKHFPFTRITEHKHFLPNGAKGTVLTYEYPDRDTGIPCYPVPTESNRELYQRYKSLLEPDVFVGGRLGLYEYLDMDKTVRKAMDLTSIIL